MLFLFAIACPTIQAEPIVDDTTAPEELDPIEQLEQLTEELDDLKEYTAEMPPLQGTL